MSTSRTLERVRIALIFLFVFVIAPFIVGTIDYHVERAQAIERKTGCWDGRASKVWGGQKLCKAETMNAAHKAKTSTEARP